MEILVIILFVLCIIISFFVGRRFASKPIEDKNEEIRKNNETLRQKLESENQELDNAIKHKESQLQSMVDKCDLIEAQYQQKIDVIKNTEEIANQNYKTKNENLEMQFQKQKEELENQKQQIKDSIIEIQNELESLKSTKAAAIEAARKEQEIQENQEFYTLQIPREEKRDIEILEDTKMRISKPRAIAMVI